MQGVEGVEEILGQAPAPLPVVKADGDECQGGGDLPGEGHAACHRLEDLPVPEEVKQDDKGHPEAAVIHPEQLPQADAAQGQSTVISCIYLLAIEILPVHPHIQGPLFLRVQQIPVKVKKAIPRSARFRRSVPGPYTFVRQQG